jgi:hypothetical protein
MMVKGFGASLSPVQLYTMTTIVESTIIHHPRKEAPRMVLLRSLNPPPSFGVGISDTANYFGKSGGFGSGVGTATATSGGATKVDMVNRTFNSTGSSHPRQLRQPGILWSI